MILLKASYYDKDISKNRTIKVEYKEGRFYSKGIYLYREELISEIKTTIQVLKAEAPAEVERDNLIEKLEELLLKTAEVKESIRND